MHGELPTSAVRVVERLVDGESRASLEPLTLVPPGDRDVVVAVAGTAWGQAPGAEVAGAVVAAGDGAREWLGRQVVVPRLLPCGECDACRRARTSLCAKLAPRHGLASHEAVPSRYLLALEPPLATGPEPLAHLAALADAVATPYAAILRAQIAPGELVVVMGGGVRGRFAVRLLGALGAVALVVEPSESLRARSVAAGARAAIAMPVPPSAPRSHAEAAAPLAEIVQAEARAAGASLVERKVIETTGSAWARTLAAALAVDGTAVLLEGGPVDSTLPLGALADRGGAILGGAPAHPDLLPELMALVARGALALAPEVETRPFASVTSGVPPSERLLVLVP